MGIQEIRRIKLQADLEDALGSKNVYFQPPENLKLSYPCIVYERSRVNTYYADDTSFENKTAYALTYISKDPRDDVAEKLLRLRYCSHNRHFVSDNLHHDVFDIHI